MAKIHLKNDIISIRTSFLCHSPLTSATKEPILPLPLQHPLDHDSGECRPKNVPFGDLKFHGHSYILFYFSFPWCKPKWNWVKFNGQSDILEEQGTTSWSLNTIISIVVVAHSARKCCDGSPPATWQLLLLQALQKQLQLEKRKATQGKARAL